MTEWDTLEDAFKAIEVHGGTILRFADLDWPSEKVWTYTFISPQYWHMCGEQNKP